MLQKIKALKWEISVFVLFTASRLPNLGYDIFNTDVWKWKSRIFDFGTGIFTLQFDKTIQRYHPGVTLMWIGSVAVKVYNLGYELVFKMSPPDNSVVTTFQLHFVQKLFIVIVIALTLAYIFYVLRKLFGHKYALVAVVLMALEPFYVGLTRVVHLEGLMSIFMLASFISFYMFLRNSRLRKYMVLAAFFGALAVLTKTTALFLVPFFGLLLLVENFNIIYRERNWKIGLSNIFKNFFMWLILALVFFVIFWPAMWTHTSQALQTLYSGIYDTGVEEGHIQLYFSRLVEDPGITFYPVVLFLRSSVLLLVGVLAAIVSLKRLEPNLRRFVIYALLFALFYGIEMSIPSKKLDRYLLPTIISLWFVAAAAYVKFLEKVEPFIVSFVILLLLPIYTLIALHPDYLGYYSPITGGTRTGIFIIEPKWMIGQRAIAEYIIELKEEKGLIDFGETESTDEYVDKVEVNDRLLVSFPVKYYSQMWPFVNATGARATVTDIPGHVRNTRYFIYPVWDDTSSTESDITLIKIAEIKSKGVTLYNVYEKVTE